MSKFVETTYTNQTKNQFRMKKSLLLIALAAPFLCNAASPGLVNEPAPLPSAVTSVSPSQGFVNISGNVCPLGVGEISIVFAGSGEVVPNKDVKSELYKDGELLASSTDAYVDAMGARIASVKFGTARKSTGWYEVKMAEGQFTVGGQPSPAFNLFYQIDGFCTISPASGVVEELSEIFLYFDKDVVNVELNNSHLNELACLAHYVDNNGTAVTPEYELTAEVLNEGDDWAVIIKFGSNDGIAQTFFYEGNYNINIPAGLVTTYSKNPDNEDDPIKRTNPRYNMKYVIPSFPQPVIEPEEGSVVKDFFKFVITMDDSFTSLLFADTMSSSYIYPVVDGQVDDAAPVLRVKATEWNNEEQTVTYCVIDPETKGFATEPIEVEPGEYALVLDDKSFSCTRLNDNAEVFSAPYQYFYTVKSGSSKVESAVVDNSNTVYNLMGVKVGKNLNNAEVNALPAGLYIINGKKVMVK